MPVGFLDNEFSDPELERYLDRFERFDPSVAVLGDAYSEVEAEFYDAIVSELRADHPYKRFIVVPKCGEAFARLGDVVTLGYANGYSDIQAVDLGLRQFRGRDVHVLGSSPKEQFDVVQNLTQPTLSDDPPANIVGVDWNGPHKVAYKGEYWSRDGWQPADRLSIRETVRKSLREIKRFWQEQDLWPKTEPHELNGEAVQKPDDMVCAMTGADVETREQLEDMIFTRIEDGKIAERWVQPDMLGLMQQLGVVESPAQ